MGRIVDAGIGTMVTYMSTDLPEGLAGFFYSSTRDWAGKHPGAAQAFRQALGEAVVFAANNIDGARADFGKYVKLPPQVIANIKFTGLNSEPTESSLAMWIKIMNEQKMLKTNIDANKLILH